MKTLQTEKRSKAIVNFGMERRHGATDEAVRE